jgi:hypothetical protein
VGETLRNYLGGDRFNQSRMEYSMTLRIERTGTFPAYRDRHIGPVAEITASTPSAEFADGSPTDAPGTWVYSSPQGWQQVIATPPANL